MVIRMAELLPMATGYTRRDAAKLLGITERSFSRRVAQGIYPEPDESGRYPRDEIEELARAPAPQEPDADPVIHGFCSLLREQTIALREAREHISKQHQVTIQQAEKAGAVIDSLIKRLDEAEHAKIEYQRLIGEQLMAKEERKELALQREMRARALLQTVNALEKNLPEIISQFGGARELKSFMADLKPDDKFGLLCLQNSFTGRQRQRYVEFLASFGITADALSPAERAQFDELTANANEDRSDGTVN